jgi:hypothetical protein
MKAEREAVEKAKAEKERRDRLSHLEEESKT